MIAIIKYNAGNIQSVQNALDNLGVASCITDSPDKIRAADAVIFPGVGEAKSAMSYLKANELDSVIQSLKQPFLGICLGMQLMCAHSEEGDTACLGIFDEKVKKFPAKGLVPHMGWNDFISCGGALFNHISARDDVYFVHSYYVEVGMDTISSTNYMLPFASALHKDNFYGVQFHPEKSAEVGQKILANFIQLA